MGENEVRVAAVIPAYNVENTIAKVVSQTKKFVDEVIAINDGSKDGTFKILRKLGVTVINHPKNKGLGCALRDGFKEALKKGFDIIVTLDSDGQHNPEDIERLVTRLKKNQADVVIGSRLLDQKEWSNFPKTRLYGNRLMTLFTNLICHKKVTTDSQGGYRAFKREALKKLELKAERMEISSEIIFEVAKNNLRLKEIPIKATYDREISNVKAFRDIYRILKVLTQKRLKLSKKRIRTSQFEPVPNKPKKRLRVSHNAK